jgi:hypothetical protein
MMETPLQRIVERINNSLENVIAPQIASTIVRGQLFAVVEILNQIQERFDYRHDLMFQDIQVGRQMLATLTEAFAAAGVETPEGISAAAREAEPAAGASGGELREARSRVEAAVSDALDWLDAHRARIPEAEKAEKTLVGQLGQTVLRDMMLFRPQRFDKISQRVQEG